MSNRSTVDGTRMDGEISAGINALYADAQQCAAAAGLLYITDGEPGIRRRRHGRGFGYRDASDRTVSEQAVKERIVGRGTGNKTTSYDSW
jgi:hypothetical protein